jgi:hypothetical protein
MEKVYVKKGALIKQVTNDRLKSFLQDGYKLVEMKDGVVTVKNPVTDELKLLKEQIKLLQEENKALKEKLATKKTTKAQE